MLNIDGKSNTSGASGFKKDESIKIETFIRSHTGQMVRNKYNVNLIFLFA